jgi:hypothetical protein
MKRIVLISSLLCVACVSCADKAKVKTDYERLKLNGKMKSVTETYFLPAVSGDTIKTGERTTYSTPFSDTDNNESFSPYETKLHFDRNGNIAECFMDDSASDFHFKEVFKYKGNLLASKHGFMSGEFFYRKTYRYDNKGRETERSVFDGEKHLFESVATEYPYKNTVIEKVYTEHGYTGLTIETQLEHGLPVFLTSRYDNGRVVKKWSGEYNGNGWICVSKYFDYQDNLLQYVTFVYDVYGNEVEYAIFDGDDELLSKREYHYKYDLYGNWTQQITVTDGSPEIIIIRNIIYY